MFNKHQALLFYSYLDHHTDTKEYSLLAYVVRRMERNHSYGETRYIVKQIEKAPEPKNTARLLATFYKHAGHKSPTIETLLSELNVEIEDEDQAEKELSEVLTALDIPII